MEAESETAGTKTTAMSSSEPVKMEPSDVSPVVAPMCSTSATPPSTQAHGDKAEAAEAGTVSLLFSPANVF